MEESTTVASTTPFTVGQQVWYVPDRRQATSAGAKWVEVIGAGETTGTLSNGLTFVAATGHVYAPGFNWRGKIYPTMDAWSERLSCCRVWREIRALIETEDVNNEFTPEVFTLQELVDVRNRLARGS